MPPAKGPWTLLAVLEAADAFLREAGLPDARREAEELLAHGLGCKRLDLYLDYDRPLGEDERASLRPLLKRRAAREPLQYIVGRWPFRELELIVDRRALIPRPETEELVDRALALVSHIEGPLRVADAGCGTGCIALSLLKERPRTRVLALDASTEALELCRENAAANGLGEGLACRRHDLLTEPPPAQVDLLLSNPPYVPPGRRGKLQEELAHEPQAALYTKDEQGMEFYCRFRDTLADWLPPGGLFCFEIGEEQGPLLAGLFRDVAQDLEVGLDLRGRQRFFSGVRR